jgi:3-hydroxybutyrate dehydrogenase
MGLLDGRVAVVTGSGRGIGREFALCFAREGASVVINDVGVALDGRGTEDDPAAQVCKEIEALGAKAVPNYDSVSDFEAAGRLIDTAVESFGTIDILVNNAGGGGDTALVVDISDEAWTSSVDWNLNHPFWCTRRALRQMLPRGWGRIINISSMYGKVPLAGVPHYITTKHAINGFTKAVAQETGTHGITCNAICPGVVLTDVWAETGPGAAAALGMDYDAYVGMIVASSAIKRPNTTEEVAAMAVLLCSEAGAGITGACLSVDGGSAPY